MMMEIRNISQGRVKVANLRYTEKEQKADLRNSRENNARGVHIRMIRLVTI